MNDPDSFSFAYAIKHFFFLTTIMEPVFLPEINVGTTGLQPLPLQATPRSWKVCFSPEIDILHTYSESLFERPSLL